jgi:hypothetical protein
MSKNLRVTVVNLQKGQKFDANASVLTLDKAGSFDITIKEYVNELKRMEDAINNKYSERNKAYEAYSNLYNKKQKDGWTAQEIASEKANAANYQAKAKKLEAEIEALQSAKTKLHEQYKDVHWAWQLVGNGVTTPPTHNGAFQKGLVGFTSNVNGVRTHRRMDFSQLIEGGGMAWLEVFTPKDGATGKAPNGIYVQAIGTPMVIRSEWTDFDHNTITKKVKFGSEVLLHIYTKGMYGQEVEIELIDKDIFSPNDTLSIGNQKKFTREVLAYKIHPNEDKKLGVDGNLFIENHKNKEASYSQQHVQKIVVEIVITSDWINSAGDNLKIFPMIKALKSATYFKKFEESRSFLEVGHDGVLIQTPKEVVNLPLLVGSVETNPLIFHPCRYETLVLSKQKGSTAELFNSKNFDDRNKQTLQIDIVAGKKETYLLDFVFKTDECQKGHKSKEILITNYTNTVYKAIVDASSKASHVKKSEDGLVKTETKSTNSSDLFGGSSSTQKVEIVQNSGLIKIRKSQIEFDAFYNYDVNFNLGALVAFQGLFKYFWLPQLAPDKIYTIEGRVTACAYTQALLIKVYPDIKWSFAIGWNVTADQLSVLRPSWDQKSTIAKYQIKAGRITKKFYGDSLNASERKVVRDKMTDIYIAREGGKLPEKSDGAKSKTGKLSAVVDILKETDFSLNAQIYEDNKLQLTEDFIKNAFNTKLWIDMYEIIKRIANAMDGKEDTPKDKGGGDSKINDYLKENELNKRVQHLVDALKRSPQEVEIMYPKIAFGGGWQYEAVDGTEFPEMKGRAGLTYDVSFEASPLIGMEIKWHILDLLCRRHPIAYTVLAAVKTLLTALGDNPDGIKLDFWIKGQIDTSIKYKGVQLAPNNQITIKGATKISAGIDISIMIQGKLVTGKYTSVGKLGVGGGAEVGITLEGSIGSDHKGIWIKPAFVFDGIKLKFEAVATLQVKKKRKKADGTVKEDEIFSLGDKFEGEITLFAKTFETDKLYLS